MLKKCPLCGGIPILRIPDYKRIKEIGFFAMEVGAEVKLSDIQQADLIYICNGCNNEYVDAERDIESLIRLVKMSEEKAEELISDIHYYHQEEVDPITLLKSYTGILRRPKKIAQFFNKNGTDLLYVCVSYNKTKSCAMLKLEKDENGREFFDIKAWGIDMR